MTINKNLDKAIKDFNAGYGGNPNSKPSKPSEGSKPAKPSKPAKKKY